MPVRLITRCSTVRPGTCAGSAGARLECRRNGPDPTAVSDIVTSYDLGHCAAAGCHRSGTDQERSLRDADAVRLDRRAGEQCGIWLSGSGRGSRRSGYPRFVRDELLRSGQRDPRCAAWHARTWTRRDRQYLIYRWTGGAARVGYYSASKFAVEGLSDALRKQYARWASTSWLSSPAGSELILLDAPAPVHRHHRGLRSNRWTPPQGKSLPRMASSLAIQFARLRQSSPRLMRNLPSGSFWVSPHCSVFVPSWRGNVTRIDTWEETAIGADLS